MDRDYFADAVKACRREFARSSSASSEKQLEAAALVELIAFAALVSQKLLQNGDVNRVQLDSLLALSGGCTDWMQTSGFSPFTRASARHKAVQLIERELSGLQLVPKPPAPDPQQIHEADTELSEVDRLAPIDGRD